MPLTISRPLGRIDLILLGGISLALFTFHLVVNALGHYGYFIDELYYLACSDRLAWGYVDQPPLSIVVLAGSRAIFGDSTLAIRLLPALAAAATVVPTGVLTHRLGGDRLAIIVSALAVVAMPVYLLFAGFFSMNAFEILIVTLIVLVAVRLIQEERPKDWLWIGLLTGIGLEVKHTMVLYVVAIGVGLLMTPARRLMWNRWFLAALGIAGVLLMPNLIWQAMNGFPSLEFYNRAMVNKNIPTGPIGILTGQAVFGNPVLVPLWVVGTVAFFVRDDLRALRSFGWAFLVLIGIMILSESSRPDRIAAIYPILYAAGASTMARWGAPSYRHAVMVTAAVVFAAGAVVIAPVMTPVLAPTSTQAYLQAIGWNFSVESGKTEDPLPQWLGDRLGWREMAEEVARVCRTLPPEELATTVIVTINYGEGGAMELYGRELGLPPVYGTHNGYHAWGPPPEGTTTFIVIREGRAALERLFEQVERAGMTECVLCTQPQQRVTIHIARRPRVNIAEAWPEFKFYQ